MLVYSQGGVDGARSWCSSWTWLLQALATAIASGALANCQQLALSHNQIGDKGIEALSGALATGALASLTQLFIHGNNFGPTAEEQLKVACASRGITGAGF